MKEIEERIAKLRGEALAIKLEVDTAKLGALKGGRSFLEQLIPLSNLSKHLDLADLMLERAGEIAERIK